MGFYISEIVTYHGDQVLLRSLLFGNIQLALVDFVSGPATLPVPEATPATVLAGAYAVSTTSSVT